MGCEGCRVETPSNITCMMMYLRVEDQPEHRSIFAFFEKRKLMEVRKPVGIRFYLFGDVSRVHFLVRVIRFFGIFEQQYSLRGLINMKLILTFIVCLTQLVITFAHNYTCDCRDNDSTCCFGVCSNLSTDPNNCGDCGYFVRFSLHHSHSP